MSIPSTRNLENEVKREIKEWWIEAAEQSLEEDVEPDGNDSRVTSGKKWVPTETEKMNKSALMTNGFWDKVNDSTLTTGQMFILHPLDFHSLKILCWTLVLDT